MKKMTSSELRTQFLNYFQRQQHTIVPSSSLIPGDDPTLLFTNAGMVQFKDVFLGFEKRNYTRATSSQRCVRAGGKHNDLENVGYTARHHTFFEMLGNFSFGDYFKREAIQFAWEFLIKELGLPAEKLWITVFENDDEAADIWLNEIKVDPTRFSRCGAKDNFWAMGDTGPCGPCTEIFYDHGPAIEGGPPGTPEADGDRYIEIWNLVFMQFERSTDGQLKPLPAPSVDTGMGLERLAAVMQGVHNNYDTDLFTPLLQAAAKLAQIKDITNTSLRVIADHIRSCSFLITDGITPSNEGRGYVLRRIIRRAIRHGKKLNIPSPFFYQLVKPLCDVMGEAYPELVKAKALIEKTLQREEEQFIQTLEQGLKILEQTIVRMRHDSVIPGETVFRLYDTYGFPVDLTADIARERNLTIDFAGFEQEMEKQRKRSQQTNQFGLDYTAFTEETKFEGYEKLELETKVTQIIQYKQVKSGDAVNKGKTTSDTGSTGATTIIKELTVGQSAQIVLENTPFYAESGGQVGDQGWLEFKNGGKFIVEDTKKTGQTFLHFGHLECGTLHEGDKIHAIVNKDTRIATALNHSATHLLHAALRQILGTHVTQKGSLVEPARLRFDFTHDEPITAEQIYKIERLVNQQIRENLPVDTHIMTPDEAKARGAMALFGEKYGDQVRVLQMGEFSQELCGGTHVQRTGDIGFFKIIGETGVAAGIRRIEAITGDGVLNWITQFESQMQQAATLLKTSRDGFEPKLRQLLERTRSIEKQLEQLQHKLVSSLGTDYTQQAQDIHGIKVLAIQIENADNKTLRNMLDQLKDKLGTAVVVLASVNEGRVSLVAGVTKDTVSQIKAGELINYVAQQVGGKGGGRPDMAEAGGNRPDALQDALTSVPTWIAAHLN